MKVSTYLRSYMEESKAESKNEGHPNWLRKFFSAFNQGLSERCKGASAGDRYTVTSVVADCLKYLLPTQVSLRKEVPLRDFLSLEDGRALGALLNAKRVDFVLERAGKRFLIEFKTNINFNDLSAAMTEMTVVKKFAHTNRDNNLFTGSLHLFPYRANVEGLRELNAALGSPLDYIWVLCEGPQLKFNITAIRDFRSQINRCLG